MKCKQFIKSTLALLLVLASLMGMLPAAFATENDDRQQVTIDMNELDVATDGMTEEEAAAAYEEAILEQLYDQYGFRPEETEDPEFGTLANIQEGDDEIKGETKDDAISTTYVFLDLKPGQSSRNFNWQMKSNSTKDHYFSANIQGCIAGYFQGSDARLYMPIELGSSYINGRLKQYELKKGDIARVRIQAITANDTFVADSTGTVKSYFAIHTDTAEKDPGTWQAFGTNQNLKTQPVEQTLTWTVYDALAGQKLRGLRWDPSQSDIPETRIYIDYIYVGPPAYAPVKVEYRNEANSSNLGYHYVGYGKYANSFSTGKTNSETDTTQTIWGWQVMEYKNGAWTDINKFVTDPAKHKCTVNTRFVLKSVTIRKENLNSKQTYDNGASTEDDKYVLTVDGFDTAEMTAGGHGTPLDICIILDRSGSQAELVTNNKASSLSAMNTKLDSLSKAVQPGYYRATCFRQNKHDGTSTKGFGGYIYTMPMRYYRGEWQMQCLQSCTCNGSYHASYGVYIFNNTMKPCSHVKWVDMETGYNTFATCASNTNGYKIGSSYTIKGATETLQFNIGASRLGRAQNALVSFCASVYNSSHNLPAGTNHTISVIGYGGTLFANKYPFNNGNGDTKGYYITTDGANYSACTKASTAVNVSNYESIIKAIRDTYCYGATRTDFAFQALTGTKSDFETIKGLSSTTLTKTDYLPAVATGRNRVVVLMTDGVPSSNLEFSSDVANKALAASKTLKGAARTTVYALGILTSLNDETYYTSGGDNMNNFMNLISSRYPSATSLTSAGSKVTGSYYISDTSSGSELATQMAKVWTDTEASLAATGKSGPASLWLYEDFGREWKPDEKDTVKIWAEAYAGSGKYSGTKVLIGEHKVSDHTKNQSFTGNGYKLHYYYDGTDQSFTYALQWTDAKTAFLRETALSTGSQAKALTKASLDVSKGYKVYMEMPIEVDRNNTLGGNNIKLTTSSSGCYQAKDSTDAEIGTKLFDYSQPNANVFCSVESEAHDYFVSLENYVKLLKGDGSITAMDILDDMMRLPSKDELKPANDKGVSNLAYLSFNVQLKDPKGTVVYHMAAAQNATALSTGVDNLDKLNADLLVDQKFTLTTTMKYSTHSTDSYGRAPYSDVDGTFYPTYYVPKFAVVDYGDNISIPMGEEGKNSGSITGITVDTTNNVYHFDDNNTILSANSTIPYTYKTKNIPKGAASTTINREIYILPANVVTYDESVINFTTSGWSDTAKATVIEQTYDNTALHGYDAKYASTGDFHGSAKVTTVSSTKNSEQATFTFTGTGFEIISRAAKDSGAMLVEVFTGDSIKADGSNLHKSILCNTYLSTDDYYQVPVVSWTCTNNKDPEKVSTPVYGTYTVRITAYYHVAFATRGTKNALTEGEVREILGYGDDVDFTYIASDSNESATRALASSYKVYVDGIRIYNPVEETALVKSMYDLAGESGVTFTDLHDKVMDAKSWSGSGTTGVLYLADQKDDVEYSETISGGFPLFTTDTVSLDIVTVTGATGKSETRTYYKDASGKRYKDPATGQEFWSMYAEGGGYYYYIVNPKATATRPYLTLKRDYVRTILGQDFVYYNSAYKSYGAKSELYLSKNKGIAFNTDAANLRLSLRSVNGAKCVVEVYNGSGWDVAVPSLTTCTEMFYDFSSYKGTVILKNTGDGILAVVKAKTSAAAKGIYIDKETAIEAVKAFETPMDMEVETDSLKMAHSLNLQSNISINYVVSKATLEQYDHYVLTAEVNGKTYYPAPVEKGNYIYFTLDCLTAAMMNDNVRAQLTAYAGEEIHVSPVDDYSIAVYAYTMMNRENTSEAVKSLCANLLRYGAATQTYLGYNTDALADEEMTEEQRAYLCDLDTVTFGSNYSVGTDVAEASVTWAGRTLALDSTVAMRFAVNASAYTGNVEDLELRGTYVAANGETMTVSAKAEAYNAEKGLYLFTIDTLNAADLRSVLTCRVFAGDVAVSQTMTYSADTYANGKTGTLLDLCKALFAYVDEAKAFFG